MYAQFLIFKGSYNMFCFVKWMTNRERCLQFIEIFKKRNTDEFEKVLVFFFNQLLILINLNKLFW